MMRQRTHSTPPPMSPTPPTTRRGLYAYVGHRVVELLTEQQLVDHAVSVLPQLQSVTTRPHFHGPHWTTLRSKHGVAMYEFDPSVGGVPFQYHTRPPTSTNSTHSTDGDSTGFQYPPRTPSARRGSALPHGFQSQFKLPNPGIDMAYAVVAQCELEFSITDVMDVLFTDEPIGFENSMKALWNNKLKRADLLLTRSVTTNKSPSGSLAIKTATIGNGLSLKWKKPLDHEKLCYTSYTQRSTTRAEAFHVVKTLPLDIHDQIVSGKTHTALRDPAVDHVAVGYHLIGSDNLLGSGARTRLVICAYASAITPSTISRASQAHWHPRMSSVNVNGNGIHADARRLVKILASSAVHFHQVLRQRRFGVQRFVYFPTDRSSCHMIEQCCVVCLRRFGLFRKDHYCPLCGHLVCRQCSKRNRVERSPGAVKENRMCFPCVARVDSGAFQEEKLWKNMDRAVVVDEEAISPNGYPAILELDNALDVEDTSDTDGFDRSWSSIETGSSRSLAVPDIQVAQDLFSPNPRRRASALEALSIAVIGNRRPESQPPTVVSTPRKAMKSRVEDWPKPLPSPSPQQQPRRSYQQPQRVRDIRSQSVQVDHRRSSCSVAPRVSVSGTFDVGDTGAIDAVCEAAVRRLQVSMAFVIAHNGLVQPTILGLHNVKGFDGRLPREEEIEHAYPQSLMKEARTVIVDKPMRDHRFRDFSLIFDVGARFFAQFAIPSVDNSTSAKLCVIGSVTRACGISKEEMATVQTLCSLSADLVANVL